MKVFIATEISVIIRGGKVFANQKHSTILKRYFNAFGPIKLCSRVEKDGIPSKTSEDISDIIDSVVQLQSLRKVYLRQYNRIIKQAMEDCSLVICRVPAMAAFITADIARKMNKPYLAESMGDAWDAYWNHGIVGKILAPYMFFKMKRVVKNANYAVYVTSEYLQKRYPCSKPWIAASNVLVEDADEKVLLNRIERLKGFNPKEIKVMTAAAVDVWYKGQQYVIKAIPKLNKIGIKVKYYAVGEGNGDFLDKISRDEGVSEQVELTGRIPLDRVFDLLDCVDIYIQPSLQEGLPRSVIEAMSRGCACIGANTAGIPELLQDDMVVQRKSVSKIVETIARYCELSMDEKEQIAKRNWTEAGQYSKTILDGRRNEFYKRIKTEVDNQR